MGAELQWSLKLHVIVTSPCSCLPFSIHPFPHAHVCPLYSILRRCGNKVWLLETKPKGNCLEWEARNSTCAVFYYGAALSSPECKNPSFERRNMQSLSENAMKDLSRWPLMQLWCIGSGSKEEWVCSKRSRWVELPLGFRENMFKWPQKLWRNAKGRGRRLSTCFIFISLSSHVAFERRGWGGEMTWRELGRAEKQAVDSHCTVPISQQDCLRHR